MLNFLSTTVHIFSGFGMPDALKLNWIGNIIKWLIDSSNSIGLGIILFTLMLRVITLPLDIVSKISTKKNALKMERMRPQLEKLQRQYANDKALYNQKMQALYKKEGYSMFSTCLPMIVTIVVFIIVINQFTSYSRNTNLTMINNMATEYTNAVISFAEQNPDKLNVEKDENGNVLSITVSDAMFDSEYCADLKAAGVVYENGKYVTKKDGQPDINALGHLLKTYNDAGFSEYSAETGFVYSEDTDVYTVNYNENGWERTYIENEIMKEKDVERGSITDADVEGKINAIISGALVDYKFDSFINNEVKTVGRQAARKSYLDNAPSFLWVQNLWVPDLPWKHPVYEKLEDYDFYASLTEENKAKASEFAEITADLQDKKEEPNGYLILVVLSIAVMFLSQFIMNKSQKAQLELQSADGQAAQTSKMMMWMMPIMFGVFAFIYTASFSLYMVLSSVLSTLSTVITNYFVEKNFKKRTAEEETSKDKRFVSAAGKTDKKDK